MKVWVTLYECDLEWDESSYVSGVYATKELADAKARDDLFTTVVEMEVVTE
jgi:hypothetical protein